MQSSARRGVQSPSLDRSDKPDIPLHLSYLVAALERDVSFLQGAFSARPANPGYSAYIYWATDQHLAYWWDGSNWYQLGTSDVIPQSLIDAKGDIIAGLGDNLASRLPVGSNGQVLAADNTTPSGLKWILNQVMDLVAAKGDILAGTGTDALGRVAVGPNGTALLADSAQSAGVRFGAPTLATQQISLGSDVALTTANAAVDVLSLSLAAGIWKLETVITLTRGGSGGNISGKLWDGTTVYATGGINTRSANSGDNNQIVVVAPPVTLGSTTTVKITLTPDVTTQVAKAALPVNGAGNNASWLLATQIG